MNYENFNYNQEQYNFDKIVNDVSNYLFVPEDFTEVQFLYMLGKHYNNGKEKYCQQFEKEIAEYNNIILNTAKFIKELGLQDNHTSYYIIFTYLLWNGLVSKNMQYTFTNNNLLSLNGFQGLDIINGKGSCRSISNMLNSVFQQLGYDTHFLVNSNRIKCITHVIDIERKNEKGVIPAPQLNAIFRHIEIDPVGNHASILLKSNGNYYVYDSTNLSIYKVDEPLAAKLYNGVGECHIKPWGFIMYENMKQLDILKLLSSIGHQNQSTFMSNLEIKETINETLENCKKGKSLMLDFHSQIKNSIDNIHESIFHK